MDSDGMLVPSGITIQTASTWDRFEKGTVPRQVSRQSRNGRRGIATIAMANEGVEFGVVFLTPPARNVLSTRFAARNGVSPSEIQPFPFKTVAFVRKMKLLSLGGYVAGIRVCTYVYEKLGVAGIFVTRGRKKDLIY